jgi:DNA polymerase-1
MTMTGRLTACQPNLQGIPIRTEEGQRVREAFQRELPPMDYSSIELRILGGMNA